MRRIRQTGATIFMLARRLSSSRQVTRTSARATSMDINRGEWHVATGPFSLRRDEDVFSAGIFLVARPDVRHTAVDLAVWRIRRRGRVWQPLLPYPRREDRP